MNKVMEALRSSNSNVRETAMQSLVEIGRQEYNVMGNYMQVIADATFHLARTDESEVGS